MFFFSRLRIGIRLGIGFTMVVALTLVIGTVASNSLARMGDLTANLYDHPYTVTRALLEARVEMRTLQRDLANAALLDDRGKLDTVATDLDAAYARAVAALAQARGAFLGDKARFDPAEHSFEVFRVIYQRVIARLKAGDRDAALADMRDNAATATAAITSTVQPLMAFATGKATEFMHNAAATRTQVMQTNVILLAATVLIAAAISFSSTISITRPLGALRRCMAELAGGNLAIEVPGADRHDEVGEMAGAVTVFRQNAEAMQTMQQSLEQQKHHALEERRQAMRTLADGFERQVGSVIEAVSSAAGRLQSSAGRMSDNAARTTEDAGSVASASGQAAANAQTVASASEELSVSIAEIAKRVEAAREIAIRADRDAGQTTEQVHKLSEAVTTIGAIVALINDVASQTNLLALNATIEAARAGDAGKGFAVVASEVKNLASQTAKATEEISGKIAAVQKNTEEAAMSIATITRVMAEMTAVNAAIATAVEQQSSATAEIARNVEQSAAGSQEVSTRIVRVEGAARETDTVAREIQIAASELSDQAGRLRSEVGRFLHEVRTDEEMARQAA